MSDHPKLEIPTLCFGFTLGFMVLTGSKVGRQTLSIYKRTGSLWSLYIFMIWTELLVSLTWALVSWFFLRGDIKPSFGVFFTIATLWTIQTQCLLQIIANRVTLVMVDKEKARMLKLSLLGSVLLINISVYIIWIPARMKISHTWRLANEIWDRIEKVIYLLLDLALNLYFLYLVRAKLISKGLTKYRPLFRFNATIVTISIGMDALIIGMMSLPNDFVYTQFHSLAYIVKLNIELSMADLISKVVRKPDMTEKRHNHSSSFPSRGTELSRVGTATGPNNEFSFGQPGLPASKTQIKAYAKKKRHTNDIWDDSSSEEDTPPPVPEKGIVKTVATEVHEEIAVEGRDTMRGSTSSSTAQLREQTPPYAHATP